MRVRILTSAHNDLVDGYWFYERQGEGLGDYFTDTLYGRHGFMAFSTTAATQVGFTIIYKNQ